MYCKTTEIIRASSDGSTQVYSNYYLNGYLMELGLKKASTLPITTACPIKLFRQTTAVRNLILETVCPSSETTWRPTFALTSSSTTGGAVVAPTTIGDRRPMLFAEERVLCVMAKTSKAANVKFGLITRTDGSVKMVSNAT